MPTLVFFDPVLMPLEGRIRITSDVVPREGEWVVLPGKEHRDNAYPVARVRIDWSAGDDEPEIWIYLGSPIVER